ncbi:hypothetical protein JCM8208_005108 [Rhodotorula glutinis]
MSSFLRRLRSTTRLHSPRSEPPPSSSRADLQPTSSPTIGNSRPGSPTKLRAGPARRGYEALDDVSKDDGDDGFGTASGIDSWTLDEGGDMGELGDWVWVDVDPAGAAATVRRKKDLVSLDRGRAASLPCSDLDSAPPLVPFSPSYALSPGRDPPRTPTKRKASVSSPDLSPTASFSSALLSPSSPASRTSTSSLAPPPTPSSPTPSVSLSLTIATRIDHNGRRVLTSRRRLSLKPSPCETRRHKDLYGIGDDEASGDEQDEDVEFAPGGTGLELVDGGATIRAPRTGLGMLDLDLFAAHGRSASSPPTLPHLFEARPTRPRPVALQPLVIPPSAAQRHYESPLPSPTLARLPEHQPIKTFWPPPPLDAPSSPTKSSPFSSLTRSNTTYSSRTSSSSSANGSSSAAKRHNSLLQPRRTFRRLSLSSRHGSTYSGGTGSSAAPLMSATTLSSLHERRASAPALEPLAGVDLERHTSMSSLGSASGSGAFSIPPTPGATSASSHFSLGTGASCSTSEPLLGLVRQQSLSGGGGPSAHARRASQVSFELPPSTPSEARRSAAAAMVGSDEGHGGASTSSSSGTHPPLSPSSSFARSRRHARSASEGGAALQMSVLERSWVPLEDQAERELARGRLVVVNPDTTSVPPSRPSSSPVVATSTSLSSTPPASPSFSRSTRPSRPPKSLSRWSAPPSPSPFLTSPQPPTPPAASRGIGIVC